MSKQRILAITYLTALVLAVSGYFYIRNAKSSPAPFISPRQGQRGGVIPATDLRLDRARWESAAIDALQMEMRLRLERGDNREKIERVLKEKKMPFHFDALQQCYETDVDLNAVRTGAPTVTLVIYVDGSNRLTKIEGRVPPLASP